MKLPQVIDKTEEEIAAIIKAINEAGLPDGVKVFIIQCIELAIWIPHQLTKKTISLSRLRTLIFGKGYKHNKKTEVKKTTSVKTNQDRNDSAKNNTDISPQKEDDDLSDQDKHPNSSLVLPTRILALPIFYQ